MGNKEALGRIKKAINYLIYCGVADSEKELAEKLGYTKSSFSQIVNGKVPLSDRFIDKLCRLDPDINKVYIADGEGELLSTDTPNGENMVIPMSVWEVIQKQADSLKSRDRQIDELISLLSGQIKKMDVPTEDNATSVAVG
jgi:transcriptional regulator with XRE-family HTH domain